MRLLRRKTLHWMATPSRWLFRRRMQHPSALASTVAANAVGGTKKTATATTEGSGEVDLLRLHIAHYCGVLHSCEHDDPGGHGDVAAALRRDITQRTAEIDSRRRLVDRLCEQQREATDQASLYRDRVLDQIEEAKEANRQLQRDAEHSTHAVTRTIDELRRENNRLMEACRAATTPPVHTAASLEAMATHRTVVACTTAIEVITKQINYVRGTTASELADHNERKAEMKQQVNQLMSDISAKEADLESLRHNVLSVQTDLIGTHSASMKKLRVQIRDDVIREKDLELRTIAETSAKLVASIAQAATEADALRQRVQRQAAAFAGATRLLVSPLLVSVVASLLRAPTIFGIPVEFFIFAQTVAGVALFHQHALSFAIGGFASHFLFKLSVTGFKLGPGLSGFAAVMLQDWPSLVNLLMLLTAFAIVSSHFEESRIPVHLPQLLPDGWRGGFTLLSLWCSVCPLCWTTSPQPLSAGPSRLASSRKRFT